MKSTFLSRFTPSMMTPKALEATFVQREALAQRIIELIHDSALTPTKHHNLIIGPRGIGKTHLISLIYHRIQAMEDLRDRLLIAWLREEEWGITSFLDLLLRIFRALQAEHEDTELKERIEALYNLSQNAAERAGAELLKEFVGNQTLLILIENLDDLFNGLGDEGQKQLRAYLQENPFCTILATAQSLFNGVSLQTSPFYGFFRIHHLEGLSLDDTVHLLTKIANLEGDQKLASFIQTPVGRARIRAIHHLAGGNHRVYVIFSQFLTCESIDDLVEPFMHTLDDLTPYYQARIAWLSQQQRKIIEFLCDRRAAATVKEIAQRCFMTHQTASSQLMTLREMGYVHSESIGRQSYYELREPLMRFCIEIKNNRGEPIQLIVKFLRLWYSQKELQHRLELAQSDAVLEREYLLHALQVTKEEAQDPLAVACFKDCKTYTKSGDFTHALEAAEELVVIRGNAQDWAERGHILGHLKRWDEALISCDKAIYIDPNYAWAWYYRGWALYRLKRYKGALISIDKSIDLNPNNVLAWLGRGQALIILGRLEEALDSNDKAIELAPNNASVWYNRGTILSRLRRYKEALIFFDKVIGLSPNSVAAWFERGEVLVNLARYDEALVSFNKAIESNKSFLCAFFKRAETLLLLNHWDEGYTALDDSLSRFAHDEEHVTNHTVPIVSNLFNNIRDAAMWRTHISKLMELYTHYKVISALEQGLTRSIESLKSPTVSNETAQVWRDVWKELAGDRFEFQLSLRLLNAAVRYRESQDQRILLELPVEERSILNSLLKTEEPSLIEQEKTRKKRNKRRNMKRSHGA